MTAKLKSILKWAVLIILAAYVVVMVFWARAEAEKHTCKGISVSMSEHGLSDTITVRGVRQELMKYDKKIVGAPIHTVNTLDIERYLMGLNNFEDVKCFISTNGFLNVRITPMVPEIRVFDGDKSYYVNKDGKKINSDAKFYTEVPIVVGRFSRSLTPQCVLPIVRFVEKDPDLKDIVTMYIVKDKDNILLVPRMTGHVINFGDTTRLDEKKQMLLMAYQKIIPYKGWEEYDTISVRFRGQIVATRRDKTPLYPIEDFVEEEDPEEAALPRDSV